MREETLLQYETILSMMNLNIWYRRTEFMEALHVKERRVQTLLKELIEKGDLIDNGVIKGKRYKKV